MHANAYEVGHSTNHLHGILTIITIVKNDQAGLDKTLQSARNYAPWVEHCVIDGSDAPLDVGSSDGMVRYFFGRDYGISHAFNRGVLQARGKYVLFLNAGDELIGDLAPALEFGLANEEVDCALFSVNRIHLSGETSTYRPKLRYLAVAMTVPHQGMIIKRDLFSIIGLFPIQKYSMDHYIASSIVRHGSRFSIRCVNNVIATYPHGGHSTAGGIKPFIYNVWNVARIAPKKLPWAVLANFYLSIKSALTR